VLEKTQSPQAQRFNAYDRPHDDLREFIARAERAGEIVRIAGADWKLEMGTLAEIVNHARPEPPAILFEEVPGYPKGMRLLSGATNSSKRLAIALGLPVPRNPLDVVRAYRDRMKTHRPIPPTTVAKGPVFENTDRDGKVDVLKFPVPFLHEHDGGRYIGTDDLVIMRDPEADWVNGGTYRVMVHDKTHVSLWISPGKHGRHIREKYFRAGKPCPVLISCGHDPLLFLAGGNELKFGLCEYDYAGGHRGEPYEIVLSELHGLPMRPMPRSCSKARWWRTSRRRKDRSGSSRVITPRARASSRWSRSSASITATIRSSVSPRRCARRRISPSANA
jgi:UbiD family decarboxylase